MTDHRFLTADRTAESTRFGKDVEITVNYGAADFATEHAVLPPYGFLIESPTLVGFHARSYRGTKFSQPTMLVVQSADGKRLKSSKHIQMYAGFGDRPPTWNAKAVTLKP